MQFKDYAVLGIILVCVIAAIVFIVKQKVTGKRIGCGSCCGKCAECDHNQSEKREK